MNDDCTNNNYKIMKTKMKMREEEKMETNFADP